MILRRERNWNTYSKSYMPNPKPFYITTTLPYVNAEAHLGHALEFIRADSVARWKKLSGYDVFFNTGTDEHGLKIFQKAAQANIPTQAFVDAMTAKFKELLPILGISPDVNFIRTTDEHHMKAAQEFWRVVEKNGYIYKKNYSVKYCIGCELEKTESELVDGKCPLHPLQEIELINEENYFFKFSAFGKKLLDLYEKPSFVIPESRQKEIRTFVERGLEDFSVSRLKSKMPWGISVPDDEEQVMYVWFDALVNYVSAIGWPDDVIAGKDGSKPVKIPGIFEKWSVQTGGMIQYCGKDNLRQQSAMWQAMLMAAGLPTSKTVIVDGFVTGDGGVKMSKSLGNSVDPIALVKEFGTDAMRYYCLRELQPFEDSPCTAERFKDSYNANLANGLGNLVSRIMKMAETSGIRITPGIKVVFPAGYEAGFSEYNLKKSMDSIWDIIAESDKLIQVKQPFKLVKSVDQADKSEGEACISALLGNIYTVGVALKPFMPDTAAMILECVENNKMPSSPLFLRK